MDFLRGLGPSAGICGQKTKGFRPRGQRDGDCRRIRVICMAHVTHPTDAHAHTQTIEI